MRHALVTIVRDEAVMLPHFMRYYRQHFPDKDIYIYDNGTADGSLDEYRDAVNVIDSPSRHAFDHTHCYSAMNKALSSLLGAQGYDSVLHADCDEIVCPSDSPHSLRDFMDANREDVVTTSGFEIYHADEEAGLDWSGGSLLSQRAYWFGRGSLNKPLLMKAIRPWRMGHHACEGGVPAASPGLFLLHLHRADWDTCVAENDRKSRYSWHPGEAASPRGAQNRLQGKALRDWFVAGSEKKVKYPDWVKEVL